MAPKGEFEVPDLALWVLSSVEIPKLCTDDPINTSVHSLFNDSVPGVEGLALHLDAVFTPSDSELVMRQKPGRSTFVLSGCRCWAEA